MSRRGTEKAMDFFPLQRVRTAKDSNRGRGVHHVSIGTAAKRQPEFSLPTNEIGKRVVLSVVIGSTNIRHLDLRKAISSG